MMDDQFQALRKVLDTYPDYYNVSYPHSIKCPPEDGDDVTLPFKKNLPKFFKIEKVEITKRLNNRCIWRVTYMLNDESDLPTDINELKKIISPLMNYTPLNAVVLENERELLIPKRVIIPYGVLCQCPQHFFDQAAQRSQAQLEEKLKMLQVD